MANEIDPKVLLSLMVILEKMPQASSESVLLKRAHALLTQVNPIPELEVALLLRVINVLSLEGSQSDNVQLIIQGLSEGNTSARFKSPVQLLRDLAMKGIVASSANPNIPTLKPAGPGMVLTDFKVWMQTVGKHPKVIGLQTYEVMPASLENTPVEDRKYVVFFNPNAEFASKEIDNCQGRSESVNCVIIAFDYPGVGSSEGRSKNIEDLKVAGIAQVNRLLDAGVPAKNIVLHGQSLGGAIATFVVDHFNQVEPSIQLFLINGRSFSTLSAAAKSIMQSSIPEKLATGISAVMQPVMWSLRLQMDIVEAYQNIPKENKMLYFAKDDEVIRFGASLARMLGLQPDDPDACLKLMSWEEGSSAHNDPLFLFKNTNGLTGEEMVVRFLQKAFNMVGLLPENIQILKATLISKFENVDTSDKIKLLLKKQDIAVPLVHFLTLLKIAQFLKNLDALYSSTQAVLESLNKDFLTIPDGLFGQPDGVPTGLKADWTTLLLELNKSFKAQASLSVLSDFPKSTVLNVTVPSDDVETKRISCISKCLIEIEINEEPQLTPELNKTVSTLSQMIEGEIFLIDLIKLLNHNASLQEKKNNIEQEIVTLGLTNTPSVFSLLEEFELYCNTVQALFNPPVLRAVTGDPLHAPLSDARCPPLLLSGGPGPAPAPRTLAAAAPAPANDLAAAGPAPAGPGR